MNQFQGLTTDDISGFEEKYAGSALCRAMTNALYKHSVKDAAFCHAGLASSQYAFSIDIPTLPVTNQKSSGRCWIFSALNVLREVTAKKCNLDKFELSQNYTAFWDKFEKANYMLESIIDLADRPTDDRTVCHILSEGVGDGGQWDMFVNLVEKYGVVPKSAMEETYQSSNTGAMNALLNSRLRLCAEKLRETVRSGGDVQGEKKAMMSEIYSFLCMCFGNPPKKFDFEYVDKDKKYHVVRDLTPKSFYEEYVGLKLREDYVSIINSPTEDKPFGKSYTVDYLGNVAEGAPVRYYNLPMDTLKSLIIRQLSDGEVVWFGSDVGKYGERDRGLWCTECYDLKVPTACSLIWKRCRTGLPGKRNEPCDGDYRRRSGRRRQCTEMEIQNSWSDEHGEKGYYLMSADWFDRYVYQAVINKKYLTKEQLEEAAGEPVHLNPWDPMGTLAQ